VKLNDTMARTSTSLMIMRILMTYSAIGNNASMRPLDPVFHGRCGVVGEGRLFCSSGKEHYQFWMNIHTCDAKNNNYTYPIAKLGSCMGMGRILIQRRNNIET
jgi:hypothetical protein